MRYKRALARLRDAAGHACFEALASTLRHQSFDVDVHSRREGGAVHEEPVLGVAEKTLRVGRGKDLAHRSVIGHDSENDAREFCDAGRGRSRFTA